MGFPSNNLLLGTVGYAGELKQTARSSSSSEQREFKCPGRHEGSSVASTRFILT